MVVSCCLGCVVFRVGKFFLQSDGNLVIFEPILGVF